MGKYKRLSKAGLCWRRIVVSAKLGKERKDKGTANYTEHKEIRKLKIILLLAIKQERKLDKQEN